MTSPGPAPSPSRPCPHLLVGVCGSIHCMHIPDYLVAFNRTFAEHTRVIMTAAARDMINPKIVELHLPEPVIVDAWGSAGVPSPHIRATRWADVFVVLPATANIIAKAAHGIADDVLSTAILASEQPVVFAPAMNPSMWASAALRRNVGQVEADGHIVIPPDQITSVTTGEYDLGLGPTVDSVLPVLWHTVMKRRKEAYWSTATATPPATPASRAELITLDQ
jgi:phosphopantothenoylcysteine decarboxylase/phosphopantothenate--cysteine ligase